MVSCLVYRKCKELEAHETVSMLQLHMRMAVRLTYGMVAQMSMQGCLKVLQVLQWRMM